MLLALLLSACGTSAKATSPRQEVAPLDASAQELGEVAFVYRRWDGVYEPLVCCDEGVCKSDGCDAMLRDDAVVTFASGEQDHIAPTPDSSCAALAPRRVLYASTGAAPSSEGLAVWPPAAFADVWWRGEIKLSFPRPVLEAEQARLLALGANEVARKLAAIDLSWLDLDADGTTDKVFAIEGRGGGVFTEQGDRVDTLARLTTNSDLELPAVTAAADLDGDGGLELLVLGRDLTSPTLFVVDAEHARTLTHTPYDCLEPPEHAPHDIDTPEGLFGGHD